MVVYSIKDLEGLSGVKAHTIRIWEKRYNLIQPKRTKTNIRYYTDEDLRKLLNICFLYKKGYKISKIGMMDESVIRKKVSEYSNINLSFEHELDALMIFILELDEYNLSKILDKHISQKGLDKTMTDIVYPLLDKIGVAWLAGSFLEVHESFMIEIIRGKLYNHIEALTHSPDPKSTYLIYNPKGENQELSLLYLHYTLKKNGCKVVNLGTDIELGDVIFSIETTKPDFVFTIINKEMPYMKLQTYVDKISDKLGKRKFLITGFQTLTNNVKWPSNVEIISDLSETIKFIENNFKVQKVK